MEDKIELIIHSLEKQLNQRIDKLWKIFSWTSSILVTITGGIIILTKIEDVKLHLADRIIFSVVIFVLTLYAYLWLNENLKIETKIRAQLADIFDDKLKFPNKDVIKPDNTRFGYKHVIILLGITALSATWLLDCIL